MDLIEQIGHRPWPLPEGPWVQSQRWSNILFAHWPVLAADLRPRVPAPLELDTLEGEAWVGITPFCIRNLRLRGLPPLPLVSTFPEVDVRTYVRLDEKPGVFYFSLDAPNALVAAAAKMFYHMPYVTAEVEANTEGDHFHFRSRRERPDAPPVEFEGTYWPDSEVFRAEAGTREEWLIERWALYTVDREGEIDRVEIHRPPWPLQQAQAELRCESLAAANGLTLPGPPPMLHLSTGVESLIWLPKRARP